MTYYEITQKMKDLSMTPSDWSWLSKYLIETSSVHAVRTQCAAQVYDELVNAYQARKAGKPVVCGADHCGCRYCGYEFRCEYSGFCGHQRGAA